MGPAACHVEIARWREVLIEQLAARWNQRPAIGGRKMPAASTSSRCSTIARMGIDAMAVPRARRTCSAAASTARRAYQQPNAQQGKPRLAAKVVQDQNSLDEYDRTAHAADASTAARNITEAAVGDAQPPDSAMR